MHTSIATATAEPAPDWITATEATRLIKRSTSFLTGLAVRQEIRVRRSGARLVYNRLDVEAVARQERGQS
jgi:hypothetical protein